MQTPPAGEPGPGRVLEPGLRVQVLRGYKCLFGQPDWLKTVAMVCLYIFIPMVGSIALQGYAVRVLRHLVITGNDERLPPFEGFSELIGLGLQPFMLSMIWTFPLVFVIYFLIAGAVAAGVVAAAAIVAALAAMGLDPALVSGLGALAGVLVGFLAFAIVYLGLLLLAYPLQAAMLLVEITGKLEYGWNIKKIRDLMRVLGREYARAYFGQFLANIVLMSVGLLLCYIGFLPATAIMTVASAHIRSQMYRIYLARGGEPLPLDPRV